MMTLNDLESEVEYLLGWYGLKKKYYLGLTLTLVGTVILIIKIILLQNIFPHGIVYQHEVIVYNGTLIKLYVGITMGSIGGIYLLIGLPLLIIYTKKRNRL